VPKKKEMTLRAAKTPQLRKKAKRDWSKAKAERFLNTLADTCNVTEACRQSRISTSTVYRRRKSDAAFRAGWVEAVGCSYQRLELALLERALNGTERVILRKDGSEERFRDYSDQLGLALMRMHRDTAAQASAEPPPAQDMDDMRERLINKLFRLKNRLEDEGPEA
jgi:hypothetical protein